MGDPVALAGRGRAVVIAVGRDSAADGPARSRRPVARRGRGAEGGAKAIGSGPRRAGSGSSWPATTRAACSSASGGCSRELQDARGGGSSSRRVSGSRPRPDQPLRGHQLGYRPKTNSYDGWDLDQWERYIRDLAVFGTNAIELIPPRSDDDADSPHFPRPPMEMMVGMSRLADEYGLDVWIWYPAMDRDYADPTTVDAALKEWGEVFAKLPRVDAVFVPGGDPGHTRPEGPDGPAGEAGRNRSAATTPRPRCGSRRRASTRSGSTSSSRSSQDEPALARAASSSGRRSASAWPSCGRRSRRGTRSATIPTSPTRISCQYPVPDWDLAFALTEGREAINPRPLDQAAIFRTYRDVDDRLHHLFRGLQRRRQQVRLERPRLGPGGAGRRHPAAVRPLLHRRPLTPTASPRGCSPSSGTGGGRC